MPRYKSTERDENGATIYKDVCNPITAEFREELYINIIEAYERAIVPEQEQVKDSGKGIMHAVEMPEFSVTASQYERDGSNIKGLARIYIEESFIVNNVNILQGKENIFVSMPAYKTKQNDENGKPIYQDVCYPVTKEFREKLYAEIVREYEQASDKNQNQARDNAEKPIGSNEKQQEKKTTPFR